MDDHGLRDLRFQGYTNEQLAQQIDALRAGAGSQSFHDAATALIRLSVELAETDRVLRLQLAEIGVTWQGEAAEGGVNATKEASVYADQAVPSVNESAKGVATQSGQFAHTRNSAPDSECLRGPSQTSGWDRFMGALGHTTDNAADVRATNAAREQAIGGLSGYQSGSAEALGRAQTLPVPPGMDLVTRPAGTGTDVSRVGFGGPRGSGYVPGGSGGGAGALSELPGGGGPGPGGPFPGPGGPGPAPGQPGNPLPGPGGPGPHTGIGQPPPLPAPAAQGPNAVPRGLPNPLFLAETAALAAGGAGGAAAGSLAEKDRLVRGKPGGPPAPASPGQPPEGKQPARGGAVTVGSVPDDEARQVRNAERFGAKPGRPTGAPLMQPASTARDEEDTEHVRRFGVDSQDVFEDERLISPSLIGDEDEQAD